MLIQERASAASAPTPQGFRLNAATGLHKGDRPYQQDQVLLLAHPHAKGCVLCVVADGMGGRSGGRRASDQVMLTARQLFERYHPAYDDSTELLRQLVHESHEVIKLTAIASEQEPHSTLAAFLLLPDGQCTWIHAGDSRVYQFRANQMIRRTKDHSYVQALIDRGDITEAQAAVHPKGNILLGCLGMRNTQPPDAVHVTQPLMAGDVLMVCSDGLWHYFTENELATLLTDQPPRAAIEILLAEARARAQGNGDNISVAILKLEPLPPPPDPLPDLDALPDLDF